MDDRSERWNQITPSPFAWEREALAFVRGRLPDCEPYRAWANLEFVADDGSVYEVDLLVLTPVGFFLVEIKSWPGPITGDAHTWVWRPGEGRPARSYDNPLQLANSKAKKLRSLLQRQKALKGVELPFLQAKVFLSHEAVQPNLEEHGRAHVCVRDREALGPGAGGASVYPGIMGTLKGLTTAAREDFQRRNWRQINAPTAKAIAQGVMQAGIRPSNRSRRIGADWLLGELLAEGPGYQDFLAQHQGYTDRKVVARVRVFGVGQPGVTPPKETLERAARREFDALRHLGAHPGILRPESFTESERGPALIFPHDPGAVRLDHFLQHEEQRLGIDQRLHLMRRLADAVAWAHEHRLVHRALGPHSVLVREDAAGTLSLQVANWQTVSWSQDPEITRTRTGTAHPDALVEEPGLVYMAPEAHQRAGAAGTAADVFSLGAIAWRLFAGKPPAADLVELSEKLRAGPGLQLASAVDGASEALCSLIAESTHPSVTDRLPSARDFMAGLDLVEEALTAPAGGAAASVTDPDDTVEPLQATKGDRLPGGFTVVRSLGMGSTAIAFLVERDGVTQVLKLALSAQQNERLRQEAEVLQALSHPHVVKLVSPVEIGDRVGLLLPGSEESATLRERLRKDGRLARDFLQRFGDHLLSALDYLEQSGHAHRDIKPENLAIVPGSGKALSLVLFDFSLAREPVTNTRAGTPDYLDPFLPARKRWDVYAERFSAAVTLYEMATNALPRWGDGQSDPASLDVEVTIESDLFESTLRGGLSQFFARALRRRVEQRYDNALDMRRAWQEVFENADKASAGQEGFDEEAFVRALPQASPDTPLTALPFGTLAQEALERLGATSVRDALAIRPSRLATLRGLGHRTRKDLLAATRLLADAFPPPELEPPPPPEEAPAPPRRGRKQAASPAARAAPAPPAPLAPLQIDELAALLVPERTGKAGRPMSPQSRAALRLWVGLDPLPTTRGASAGDGAAPRQGPLWPAVEDVAHAAGLERGATARATDQARQRWAKEPHLQAACDELVELLRELGVATVQELEQALLAWRGSAAAEPRRDRELRAVTRALLEAEQASEDPRWALRRAGRGVLVALEGDDPQQAQDALDYLERLGQEADALAEADPLPAPQRVEAALRLVPAPPDLKAFPSERLVRLAAGASRGAAASSRLELYPQGLAAPRALQLAAGALAGVTQLTPDELRKRVALRYPEADPLPPEPERLGQEISRAGLDLTWDAAQGCWLQRLQVSVGLSSQTRSGYVRQDTAPAGAAPAYVEQLSPDEADARLLEERLQRSARDGSFLVLLASPHGRTLQRAARELRRFGVTPVSLDARFLHHLRAACEERRVAWPVLIEADAAGPEGKHWGRLQALVRQALDRCQAELLATPGRVLLTDVGALGRYDRLDVLGALRAAVDGRTAHSDAALQGLWILCPDENPDGPAIDGRPIPVLGRAQYARLTAGWLENVHRAAPAAT